MVHSHILVLVSTLSEQMAVVFRKIIAPTEFSSVMHDQLAFKLLGLLKVATLAISTVLLQLHQCSLAAGEPSSHRLPNAR